MTPDGQLLRQYADDGSEAAFAELVRRYIDLVYSVALRQAAGDTALAQDVTQTVFVDLARKSRLLCGRPTLSGWLHTSARFAASKAIRGEQRRRAREQESLAMENHPAHAEMHWVQLRPLLDESIGRLTEADRDAIVLRFFQSKSHQAIGAILGLSENSANKRVERALEKLRGYFAKRGVTTSSAILAAGMSANSVHAAPVGLAGKISLLSSSGFPNPIPTGANPLTLIMKTKTKSMLAVVAIFIVIAIAVEVQLTPQQENLGSKMPATPPVSKKPQSFLASQDGRVTTPVAPAVPAHTGNVSDPNPLATTVSDDDPQANLSTAIPDIVRLYRSGDVVAFSKNYTPPDALKSEQTLIQRIQDQQAKAALPEFSGLRDELQKTNEGMAKAYAALEKQTPRYNEAGDKATYIFILPPTEATPLTPAMSDSAIPRIFVKIDGKWYLWQ